MGVYDNLSMISYSSDNEKLFGSKMNILLDLDSTVICSLDNNELKNLPKKYNDEFIHWDMNNYYRIFERPYLQLFLDYLFSNYNVSIFTAADKDYALFIADNIILKKPGRKLKYLFHGYHSDLSEKYYKSPKDLRILWDVFNLKTKFRPCNTIILDDLDEVYDNNPYNSIAVEKFEILDINGKFNKEMLHDNFLLKCIPIIENLTNKMLSNKCLCSKGYTNICKYQIYNNHIEIGKPLLELR